MKKTRAVNSLLNMMAGALGQVITIVLGFASRTVFIYTLGKNYLGVSGLFQNVLQVLSISNLGLESAIVFSLYKPLAEGDNGQVAAIMTLYKRAYRVIGAFITVAGLALIPALPLFTKGYNETINITVVYLLYLFQTVSSYVFLAYRRTVYVADQRNYRPSLIRYALNLVMFIAQIVSLLLWHDYYAYLIIGVAMTVLTNVIIGIVAGREYPYIRGKTKEKISPPVLANIKKNVVGTALYRIAGVATNSTDNLLISLFIGVDLVGIYSNYRMILNYLQLFLATIFESVTASIGNLFVTGTKEHNEFVFKCLNQLNVWLYGYSGIALFCLINPFIVTVWLHDESYVLPFVTVFLIFAYLELVGLQLAVHAYRSACGLFWKGKFRPLATVLVNLIVSIVLGKYMGLNGILLGTIISHLATLFWYDPILLYREIFQKSPIGYFVRYLSSFSLVTLIGLGLYYICSLLPLNFGFFVVRFLLVLIVPPSIFFLIYGRTEEFAYLKGAFKRTVGKRLGKFLKKKSA